jgi:glycerate 2-kinase
MRVLAAPGSLKGVLPAPAAADALARGLRNGGAEADTQPVADGGDGTLDVLERALGGKWLSATISAPLGGEVDARWLVVGDTAYVESAAALGFHTVDRLDPVAATSRGLGELLLAAARSGTRELVVCLGGTVTVDGGAGMREVFPELPLPTRAVCDVSSALLDAVYVFAAQKGAEPGQLDELAERLRGLPDVPGSGAAGGLGGAFAALGAQLVPGAPFVLETIGFDPGGYDLVVSGEGAVDATTFAGKAPGEVKRRCDEAGVHCELFSARDDFSGDPANAVSDLEEYGAGLARAL